MERPRPNAATAHAWSVMQILRLSLATNKNNNNDKNNNYQHNKRLHPYFIRLYNHFFGNYNYSRVKIGEL